jgi:ribonuclease E
MSRQRISPPVKDGIFEECSQCMGSGHIRSINSIVLLVFRKVQELIAKGRIKVISLEISPEVAAYILNNKMDAIFDLKEKYQLDFKFINKPGLSFEDFKFEVLETKEEMDEESTKLSKRKNKETSKKEEGQTQAATETVGAQKLDTETNSTQPKKRRYTKRKPTTRRGQTRGRGKRPYSSRENLEKDGFKKTAEEKSTPPDFIEPGETQFNNSLDNIEVPIIPLPAPYVRPKAENDSPGSVPDGNVNDG